MKRKSNRGSIRFLSLVLAVVLTATGMSFPSRAAGWDPNEELLMGTGEDESETEDFGETFEEQTEEPGAGFSEKPDSFLRGLGSSADMLSVDDMAEYEGGLAEGYLGVKTEAKVYDDFVNDIWLQYQQKEMQVGDNVDLYPWRLEQIVTDTINNDVARPNFHFEIIAGDSVELSTEKSDDKAVVTAVAPGTSVVKVTYDAMDYKGKHWDAISDVNTAYAVYTVGEEGSAEITVSPGLRDWRHYDTIYYTKGETTPYTFSVDAEGAERVRVTLNGQEIQGNGSSYTANLENRSNIIGIEATDADGKIKSLYRVVDARFMEVKVENKTSPDKELGAGDTANISFRGITMPVYKLATIYNPTWTSFWGDKSTRVLYSNAELGEFEGACSQWDLATNNDFDVTFPHAGEYLFQSGDGIFGSWWGEQLGKDQTMQGAGNPNTSANTVTGYFSFLPDFTVSVADSGQSAAKEVEAQIDALGEITSLAQEESVTAARAAYEALTDAQKELVPNLDKLTAAEEKIAELKIPTEGGTATVDIERFTLGQGFYREPVKVEFEAGDTVRDILKALEGSNLKFNKAETYLSGIQGADSGVVNVPAYISEKLNGPTTEEAKESGNADNILGEFDYSQGSGWYYFVNNAAPDVGVAEYYVRPGDVIRLQFTLVYGMDLTGSDKDEALELLAEVNSADNREGLLADKAIREAYDAAVEMVQNTLAEQKAVDEAAAALRAALEKGPENPGGSDVPELNPDFENAYEKTAAYLKKQTPDTGSEGGEWAVLGLARSEFGVTDSYKNTYLTAVRKFIKENINSKEQLHSTKSTENARVIAALAAVGIDPTRVEGHNLLKGLTDLAYLQKQGLNGPIWALIAFDTKDFEIPGTLTREKLVDSILSRQLADGGWTLSEKGTSAEIDMTAMALYALAPYVEGNAKVKAATEKALLCLSGLQQEDGGFAFGDDGLTAESCAQVLVALSALGIDAETDSRFVKGEGEQTRTVLDALLTFYVEGGGFRHTNAADAARNQMATEQAFYAMTAYLRYKNDESRLFDMTDNKAPLTPILPIPGGDEEEDKTIDSLYNREFDVTLEGDGLTTDMELVIRKLSASHEDVTLMRKKIPSSKALFRIFEAKLLKDGKEIELPKAAVLTIPVGDKYDGQRLQILQCRDSRVDTSLRGKVANGVLTVDVTSLGSFGVVVNMPDSDNSILDVQDLQNNAAPVKKNATAASASAATSRKVSNTIKAKIKNGIVEKKSFEEIKGEDKNLKIEGFLMVDGKYAKELPYTLIINGKDVKKAKDFKIAIREGSLYEKEIGKLAEEPYIFRFDEEGDFPGEMQAELTLKVKDGEYLLLKYDEDAQKLVLCQKVEVKDGGTRFLVSEGGTYVLAKRATTKSLGELKNSSQALGNDKNGFDEDMLLAGTGPAVPSGVWIGLAALVVVLGVLAAVLYRRKRQAEEAEENEDK